MKRSLIGAAGAALALGLLPAASAHGASVAPAMGVAKGSESNLSAVAALSRSDVWAVGGYAPRSGGSDLYSVHWDGSHWHALPMAEPDAPVSEIFSISAVSPDDIWAAGLVQPDEDTSATLLEHWDGTAWSIVDSPTPPGLNGQGSYFTGIDALSDNDIWAVGFSDPESLDISQAMVEHWDGTSWTQEPITAPGLSQGSGLNAVSFDGPDDGWAVGLHQYHEGRHVPLTEHWDGSSWSYVASPMGMSKKLRELSSVDSLSAGDAWAVGTQNTTTGDSVLIDHWDGTSWSAVDSPATPAYSALDSVSAVAADDIWAVGTADDGDTNLAEHWDGTDWTIVAVPSPPDTDGSLTGVSSVSSTSVWTVGSAFPLSTRLFSADADRWNGSSWRLFG